MDIRFWPKADFTKNQVSIDRPIDSLNQPALNIPQSPLTFASPLSFQRPGLLARQVKSAQRQLKVIGAFLCPWFRFMVARCGRPSGLPGSFCPGLADPHVAATLSTASDSWRFHCKRELHNDKNRPRPPAC